MTKPLSNTESPDQKTVSLFHKKDDVDSARSAHHHTIGVGIYQVASGKHNHIDDGQLIYNPTTDIITGSRGGATASVLAQVITLLTKIGVTDSTTP